MGILSQQLIGSGNLSKENAAINPFPQPPEREVPALGFAGFRYARDADQRELFQLDAYREGPQGIIATDTVYGGEAGTRPTTGTTVLGQLAIMMNLGSGGMGEGHAALLVWNNKKIGHSIMSSEELRSFKDTTLTPTDNPSRPIYHASGGAFKGYKFDNKYGVSNWLSADKINVGSNRKATAAETNAAFSDAGHSAAMALSESGVDYGAGQEVFRPTDDINTGLRSLPVSSTA